MRHKSTGHLSIRLLTQKDAEQLGNLLAELARDPEARHFHPHPLTREEGKRLAERIPIVRDLYFGAFVESRLAGYGMLRGWDEGYAIPSFGVAVEPASRGKGLGRKLLRYAITAARERGAKSMILKVHDANLDARHLYESEGFSFSVKPGDDGQTMGALAL